MVDRRLNVNLFWGGLICGIAVALGAFGAHALETTLANWYQPDVAADRLASWETGVRYQFFHGLALLVLGLMANAGPNRSLKISHYCFISGVVVFSGGLYAWVLTGHTFFVMVVPLGGLSLIAGWVAFVTAVVWSAKSVNGASD